MTSLTVPTRWPHRRPLTSLRHNPARLTRHIDVALIAALACVCGLGLLMVYSATRGSAPPYDASYVKKQIMFMMIGGLIMAGFAWVDYRKIRDLAPVFYGVSLVLLGLVLTPLGRNINGTKGWFVLGPFQLQPSELAKMSIVLALAALAARFRGEVDLRRLVALLLLAGIPVALITPEPDLGQSLVIGCMLLALLVMAGAQPRHLAVLAVVAGFVVFGVLRSGALDTYQKARLTSFTHQDLAHQSVHDQRNGLYNLNQAKVAIVSGGLTGKGVFHAPQTKLGRVPEQRTDFIFTAVGEQVGFVGSAALLALYSLIIWRIWRTAQLARDDFGRLVCVGILGMFLFQIFENAGMAMGIMPITGITLPFMSYGGSSLLIDFAALGLVLNVHMRRFS